MGNVLLLPELGIVLERRTMFVFHVYQAHIYGRAYATKYLLCVGHSILCQDSVFRATKDTSCLG